MRYSAAGTGPRRGCAPGWSGRSRILKRVIGYMKMRYRRLKKIHEWLLTTFALVNLYQHRK
jgi:hypothetical protein